jgi:AmmeMemoRadiSam system protein B
MGPLKIDAHFAALVSRNSRVATLDQLPHLEEHSIEVLLPLIRRLSPDALIVPIAMSDDRPSVCRDIGEALAAAIRLSDGAADTLIVASTDMSHYIPASQATVLDQHALDRIKALDPEGLLSAVEAHGLTMCGAGPVAAALFAARACGATNGELVEYTSSAAVTGDQHSVVAYAGMVIR